MYTIALALSLLELTLQEMITDIPHDFPALVVYTMLALFIAGIWYGSRTKSDSTGGNAGDHA